MIVPRAANCWVAPAACERHGAGGLGRSHGGAPLLGVPQSVRGGAAACGGVPGRRVGGAAGLVARAFKVGVRDRWIGWAREQQFRRLHLIACNTRSLVLPGFRVPNLASRVLGLSLRRPSSGMEALRGHPILLAETFVDPAQFEGTCCRAAGWTAVGETRGFARDSGSWREHGRPKAVWVCPLRRGAAEALGGLDEPGSWGCGEAGRLRSLSVSCANGMSCASGGPRRRPPSASRP